MLELIRRRKREVAAVVNEFGETIGILTFDDILDTIFSGAPSRSERLLRREPIRPITPGVWHVTGMTSLRRLVRYFQVEQPPTQERHGCRRHPGGAASACPSRATSAAGDRSTSRSSTCPCAANCWWS